MDDAGTGGSCGLKLIPSGTSGRLIDWVIDLFYNLKSYGFSTSDSTDFILDKIGTTFNKSILLLSLILLSYIYYLSLVSWLVNYSLVCLAITSIFEACWSFLIVISTILLFIPRIYDFKVFFYSLNEVIVFFNDSIYLIVFPKFNSISLESTVSPDPPFLSLEPLGCFSNAYSLS